MQHLISQYGYLAVFVLMLAESACIPVPSEVVMMFGGALAAGAVAGAHPALSGVRGRGLWLALVVDGGAGPAVQTAAREEGFLVNAIGPDAVRLVPPLVLSDDEADSFTAALPRILNAAVEATRLAS